MDASSSPVRDQYCPGCAFNMTKMGDPAASEAFRRAMAEVLFVNRSSLSVDSFASNGYLGGWCIGGNCNSPQIAVAFTVTVPGADMNAYLSVTSLLFAFYEAANSATYYAASRNSLIASLANYGFPNVYFISQLNNYYVLYQAQIGFPTAAPTLYPTRAPVTAVPSSPNTQLFLPSSPAQNVTVANLGYGRFEEKFWNIAPPSTAAPGQVVFYRVKFVTFDTQDNYDWLLLGPTGQQPSVPDDNAAFQYGTSDRGNGWFSVSGREVYKWFYQQYLGVSILPEVTIASSTGITLHFRSSANNYCYSYTYTNGGYTQVFCPYKGFKVEVSQVGGVPTKTPTNFIPGYTLPALGTFALFRFWIQTIFILTYCLLFSLALMFTPSFFSDHHYPLRERPDHVWRRDRAAREGEPPPAGLPDQPRAAGCGRRRRPADGPSERVPRAGQRGAGRPPRVRRVGPAVQGRHELHRRGPRGRPAAVVPRAGPVLACVLPRPNYAQLRPRSP
jgi:hypothetical protein